MEKQLLQVGTSKTKVLMKKMTLWLLHFLLLISNSGDADQQQMGTNNFKPMASGPRCYERVAKASKTNHLMQPTTRLIILVVVR